MGAGVGTGRPGPTPVGDRAGAITPGAPSDESPIAAPAAGTRHRTSGPINGTSTRPGGTSRAGPVAVPTGPAGAGQAGGWAVSAGGRATSRCSGSGGRNTVRSSRVTSGAGSTARTPSRPAVARRAGGSARTTAA